MVTIYTTEKIIATIFQDSDDKYQPWYDLIIKLKPRLKVLLSIGTDYGCNDYNPVYAFEKDYDIDVECEYLEGVRDNAYLSKVIKMELTSVSDPFAIFILDVSKEKAKQISEKYGVVCQTTALSPKSTPIFQESVEKNIDKNEMREGWKEIFTEENTIPSNFLVFIDRYMFSEDSNGITAQDGISNISEILDYSLPKELGVDYHILMVFDGTLVDKSTSFSSISSKLNKLKNQLNRPYHIIMEAVSIDRNDFNYDETHNRRILSNYYIVRTEHSIKAFRNGHGIYTQTIWLDWLASKGIVSHKLSDTPSKALYKYIKETKCAIEQLKKKCGETLFSQNGNCKVSIKEISHRMICNSEH